MMPIQVFKKNLINYEQNGTTSKLLALFEKLRMHANGAHK